MTRVTVLVSAAGSTNGVNVIKALQSQSDYDIRLIGIDSDVYAAGLYLAHQHEVVPKVSEPHFGSRVLQICRDYDVNVLIPTHSAELHFYSANQESFARAGIKIMMSAATTLDMCDDKEKVASLFRELGFNCPKRYAVSKPASIPEDCFPLFLKSRFGSGSSYARKIHNRHELTFYLERTPAPIIEEYIDGVEYTVNVVSDCAGRVIGALPIKRLRVRSGLAVLAETELHSDLIEETKVIVETLHLVGPSNVQAIVRDSQRVFIEVNPRFASGSLPLAVAAGLNIPLIMVKLMEGEPIPELRLQGGKRMARFWDSIVM